MSLFKICSWWSIQCNDTTECYESSSMICCRIGLDDNEKDYIVVGSQTGQLSIFYPIAQITEDEILNGYRPTDLVLESKFEAPILGVLCGKFSGILTNNSNNQLAILHPFSVCIYTITKFDGLTDHGTHSSIKLLTENRFERHAFGFCKGNFGGIKGREFLCVTHLDGFLTFFEEEGIRFECRLPGERTIPSKIVYVTRIDSFVRINSSWEIECFTYQKLTQNSNNNEIVIPFWTICIGEYPLDIISVQVTSTRTAIMILGEHNLINASDNGKIEWIKRLDFTPMCFYSFVIGWYWDPNARLITAIVSETSTLLIYEETKLIWAAQLDDIPIAIQRSNLYDLAGAIITLSSTGKLQAGYLGSEPHVFQVPPLKLEEMKFETAQKELLELDDQIRQGIDMTDIFMINSTAERDLEVKISVDTELQKISPQFFTAYDVVENQNESIFMCSVQINLIIRINVDSLQVSFLCADGVKSSILAKNFNDLTANSLETFQVFFFMGPERFHPASLEVEVIVSFINKQNIPRVVMKRFCLPIKLFYNLMLPQKDASIKLTLTTNDKESVKLHKLSSIFPEFCENDDIQALGISSICSQTIVTIVAAKNTNRFRIQSDTLEIVPAILQFMISYFQKCNKDSITAENSKLKLKKSKENIQKNVITTSPYLPIDEIMKRIDRHYQSQQDIKKQSNLMDSLWNQFKLFQRSLQLKSVDEPKDGLMMLIERNYDDLVKEGDTLVALRNQDKLIRNNLSCAIALAKIIISNLEIEEKFTQDLISVFQFPVEDWTELCWEKTVAPSFELLNHCGPLSRNKTKENLDMSSTSFITNTVENFEFNRLRRHITSLMERICKLVVIDPQQRTQLMAPKSCFDKNSTTIKKPDVLDTNPMAVNDENIQSHDVKNDFPEMNENLCGRKIFNETVLESDDRNDDMIEDFNENSNDLLNNQMPLY